MRQSIICLCTKIFLATKQQWQEARTQFTNVLIKSFTEFCNFVRSIFLSIEEKTHKTKYFPNPNFMFECPTIQTYVVYSRSDMSWVHKSWHSSKPLLRVIIRLYYYIHQGFGKSFCLKWELNIWVVYSSPRPKWYSFLSESNMLC